MKKFILAIIISLLLTSSAFAKAVPSDVLVIFKNPLDNKVSSVSLASDGEHLSYIASVASELGAKVVLTYDELSEETNEIFTLIHSDSKNEQELLKELSVRPDVKGASLNRVMRLCATPNDRYYDLLWGMKAINANKVWDEETGSDSVYVAVIDSGVDVNHPDLKDNIAKEYCKAYEDSDSYASDILGHGTHVAGTIGAIGNNTEGIAGVNWKTKIIMFKTVGENGASDDAFIIAALDDVVRLIRQGVNIAAVNMSMGVWDSFSPSDERDPLWAAMKMVSDLDVILCVAAGNEDQAVGVPAPRDDPEPIEDEDGELIYQYRKGDYVYPASFLDIPNMIVVAAASQDVNGKIIRSAEGRGEAHSNYGGEYVDIAAPGSHIVSTVPDDFSPCLGMKLVDIIEKSQDIIAKNPGYKTVIEELAVHLVERGVNNYVRFAGTSMATPYVTGTVALLKAAYPDAAASQIRRAILESANGNYCKNDKNEISYEVPSNHTTDNTSKYGFLDVKAAYDFLPEIIASDSSSSGSSAGCEVGFMSAAAFILLFSVMKFRK